MKAREHVEMERRIGCCLDEGDLKQAATEALRGYGPQILSYLAAILGDQNAANEVFSRFSEDLWLGIGSFRRESSLRSWAYQIAWNAARQFARDTFVRRQQRLSTGEWSGIAEQVRSSSAALRELAIQSRLAKLKNRLEPEENTLLILRVDRDLSWKEIAQVMSEAAQPLSEAGLRKRFQRLKSKLRKLAKKEGLLQLFRSESSSR